MRFFSILILGFLFLGHNVFGATYDFRPLASEDVNSTSNYPNANIAGDSIILDMNDTNVTTGWKIEYTLTNGALFAEGNYTIEEWIGGAGTGDINDAPRAECNTSSGCSVLNFVLVEDPSFSEPPVNAQDIYGLNGHLAGSAVNFVLPGLANGATVDIIGKVYDPGSTLQMTGQQQLFQYIENLVPVPIGFLGKLSLFVSILFSAFFAIRRRR